MFEKLILIGIGAFYGAGTSTVKHTSASTGQSMSDRIKANVKITMAVSAVFFCFSSVLLNTF